MVKDRLFFYYSGRKGNPGSGQYHESGGSTGLAFLRRDGFASMNGEQAGGTLTTRLLRFQGHHLFVNADLSAGELRVEVLDAAGNPISPLDLEHSIPLRDDRIAHGVVWKTRSDLSSVSGKEVRLRFHLSGGSLYSFWVTPDSNGASFGYVAGGGPTF